MEMWGWVISSAAILLVGFAFCLLPAGHRPTRQVGPFPEGYRGEAAAFSRGLILPEAPLEPDDEPLVILPERVQVAPPLRRTGTA